MNKVFGNRLSNPVSYEEGLIIVPAVKDRKPIGALIAVGSRFSDSYIRFFLRNALQVMTNRVNTLQALDSVMEKSMFDPLTGLYTRTAMQVRLIEVLAAAKRYGRPMSVMMLDIDHFKKVNDTYGHQVGDRVLLYTTQQIINGLRESDMAARYGGEEFFVILPETKKSEAVAIGERIRSSLDGAPVPIGTNALHITISIGISCCKNGECSPEEMVRSSDRNLYQAKNSGRNKVIA
jgi:diguanylate cyclase (GGDEF)-like protein